MQSESFLPHLQKEPILGWPNFLCVGAWLCLLLVLTISLVINLRTGTIRILRIADVCTRQVEPV